jgi:acyl carrier protein
MDRSAIEAKVVQVITNEVGEKAKDLTLQTSLRKDMAIDSYSALQILFELEEAFSITIPDEAIKQAETVKDIADYLEKRLNDTGSSARASAGGSA